MLVSCGLAYVASLKLSLPYPLAFSFMYSSTCSLDHLITQSLARSLAHSFACLRHPVQVDLDLGNYERFLDITLTRDNNITTGKIYQVGRCAGAQVCMDPRVHVSVMFGVAAYFAFKAVPCLLPVSWTCLWLLGRASDPSW